MLASLNQAFFKRFCGALDHGAFVVFANVAKYMQVDVLHDFWLFAIGGYDVPYLGFEFFSGGFNLLLEL